MVDKQQALLKHFSGVLRKKANSEHLVTDEISPELTRFLSRKELIAIITEKHDGKLPKDIDLLSLENEELLSHIGDELFVISYVTKKWSEATLLQNPRKTASSSATKTTVASVSPQTKTSTSQTKKKTEIKIPKENIVKPKSTQDGK